MGLNKQILRIVLFGLSGLLIFLILVGISNVLIPIIDNSFYTVNVEFMNQNLWIVITFTILFIAGDVFSILKFPFNIPYPLFNGVAAIMLTALFVNAFSWVWEMIFFDLLSINLSVIWVYVLVFVLVLAVGYYNIFKAVYKKRKVRKYKVNNK
ncbi:MAG: hypothetical protein ABIG93_02320 [archaeon]